jgi:hypothetical protein
MARRVARSPRGAHRAGRQDIAVSTTLIMSSIIAMTFHHAQLHQLGLGPDVIGVGFDTRRAPMSIAQVLDVA